MIKIREYNQHCINIADAIGLEGYIVASTEDQAMKKLQDKAGVWMVAVYPSYSFEGSSTDSYKPLHDVLFFIATKQEEGSSNETELNQYADTQEKMIQLRDYLFGAGDHNCITFPNVDVSSVMIEPEYNIFGGYIGWSIKLSF
ncbi:hypothetical protein ACR79T_10210 [Sphingobacterium spiritivorum]|uniref:hypothetical protein n=1 Tax=Sphingobacterium spiritivorum TaxID=258 RepID=UPI003DA331B7